MTLASYVPEHLRARPVDDVEVLDGTFLFADISGFTALFEAASAEGSGGTETATRTLNRCFSKFIEAIETGGGSILKFGGDAILAYVPGGDASCRAGVGISTRIIQAIRETGRTQIGNKKIRMGVKVAVHRAIGLGVNARLGGGRLEYVPLGKAFEDLAAIEDVAERGQIVASKEAARLAGGDWGDHTGGFFLLKKFQYRPPSNVLHHPEESPSGGEDRYRLYVPDAVADRIERLGGHAAWLCEHRFVTPIFTEIRKLVPLAERVLKGSDAAELVEFLSEKLTIVREEVRRCGGIFARTDIAVEGLKAICLFGASTAVERQEISALESAIGFRDRIGKMRKDVRMGIAAGKSFACLVGSERRCDFTVIGDVMNTSARLMAAAPWGEIFALRAMMTKTGGLFRGSPCKIVAKGKKLPIEVSLVHGRVTSARESGSSEISFIGRKAERAEIVAVFDKGGDGSRARIEIMGEAGLGKTTLLEWAARRWVERGGKIWRGSCVPHGTGDAFLPWRAIVAQALRLPELYTEQKTMDRIRERFGGRVDGMASVMGFPVGTADPKLLRRMRMESLIELIRHETSRVLVVLEDIHWADTNSRMLLDDLDEAGWPAPVITTTRPSHGSGQSGAVRRLALAPLTVEETRLLAEDLFADSPLSDRRIEEIYAKASGNPLFISELFRMIREHGDGTEIPETVHAVIQSRTDRLAEFDRKILRAASVIGPAFEPEFLSELPMLAGAREEIQRALKTLALAEFIEPADPVYTFHHETIRNAVYDSMSHQLKVELHRDIGGVGERHGKESWWLAHHFEAGRDESRAVLYHERAAAAATQSRLHETVKFHATRALEILGRMKETGMDARLSLIRRIRAKSLKQLGLYREAIRDYLKSAARESDPKSEIEGENFVSSCQRLMGRHRDSLKTALRALRLVRNLGDTGQEKGILNTLSTTYWYLGEYRTCIKYGEEAYELERRAGGEPAGTGLFLVGNAYVKLADIERACGAFRTLLDIAEKTEKQPSIAYAMHGLGYCEILAGNFDRALRSHRRGYEIRKKLAEPRALAYSSLNLAECYIEMGLAPLAGPFLRHGEQSVLKIEDNNLQADLARIYGLYDISMGRPVQALDRFQRAYEWGHKLGFFEMRIKAMTGLARSYLELGDMTSARRWSRRVAKLAAESGMKDLSIWSGFIEALSGVGGYGRAVLRRLEKLADRASIAKLSALEMRIVGAMSQLDSDMSGRGYRRRAAEAVNRLTDSISDPELGREIKLRWDAVFETGVSSLATWVSI